MTHKIGELVAAEYWEDDVDNKGVQVGIIVDADKGGWYTVHWNTGANDIYHVSQIEVYKKVLKESC